MRFSPSLAGFLALLVWSPALAAPEHLPAVPVVSPVADAQAALQTDAETAPARKLTGVRLMPQPDGLRVILLLDAQAPYTVRENLAERRVEIDLIHTDIPYLPADLAQTRDRRLTGIWLGRRTPGLGTLELRLASPATRVEHFTLSDPPAVVIDLTRTDGTPLELGGAPQQYLLDHPVGGSAPAASLPSDDARPARATGSGATPALDETTIAARTAAAAAAVQLYLRPALPAEWQRAENSPANETEHATGPAPVPTPALPALTDSTASAPLRLTAEIPGGGTLVQHTATPDVQFVPLSEEFDGFPVHELKPSTPEGEDLKHKFMLRRWPQVLADGARLLKERPLDDESIQALYMMAEARWQMGRTRPILPMAEMLNYYQQAQRVRSEGDLGAFGALRIAQARRSLGDLHAAIEDARSATRTRQESIGYRARVLQAELRGELKQYAPALAQVAELEKLPLGRDRLVELALLSAQLHDEAGDSAAAWTDFERASQLDPAWMNLDRAACERLAHVAAATGRWDDARKWVEFINHNFSTRDEAANVKLLLFYADVMDHLGDTAVAEATYAVVLARLGDSEKGRAVMEELRARHPAAVVEGEQRYALLLLREGKAQQAMAEIDRAWRQCLREGIDRRPLQPVMEQVVPAYMEQASRNMRPFEAVQAWRTYGTQLHDPQARARCQPALANALEVSGLAEEALAVLDGLAKLDTAESQSPELMLQRARLLLQLDRATEAIAILEPLAADAQDPAFHAETLRWLADAAERTRQPLKAAQALVLLAEAAPEPADAADALARANEHFLADAMPLQTIDGALKGLLLERETLANPASSWPHSSAKAAGDGFLKQLARAYTAANDAPRSKRVLEEWLVRPGISAEDRAEARYRLAQNALERGEREPARQMMTAVTQDPQSPELWKRAASQALAQLDWNDVTPLWRIPEAAATTTAGSQVQP